METVDNKKRLVYCMSEDCQGVRIYLIKITQKMREGVRL